MNPVQSNIKLKKYNFHISVIFGIILLENNSYKYVICDKQSIIQIIKE